MSAFESRTENPVDAINAEASSARLAPAQQRMIRIDDVRVGSRHRRDMGDLAGLAESIAEIGLLHPIVIRPDGTLIAGGRRLAAFKLLGRTEIPVTVVDIDSVVRGEHAENVHRKDFTYAESVAIMREIKPLEEAAAKGRQGTRTDKHLGNLPTGSQGRAADKAAKATGKKRRTLEKAEQIVSAAEQNPERFADLAERLNEDDVRVDAVFREMKQRRARAAYEARADKGARIGDLKALAQAEQRLP
jgi:ParB-like chromosome segregation protein Spo0J